MKVGQTSFIAHFQVLGMSLFHEYKKYSVLLGCSLSFSNYQDHFIPIILRKALNHFNLLFSSEKTI